jgi:hypothetical protein
MAPLRMNFAATLEEVLSVILAGCLSRWPSKETVSGPSTTARHRRQTNTAKPHR